MRATIWTNLVLIIGICIGIFFLMVWMRPAHSQGVGVSDMSKLEHPTQNEWIPDYRRGYITKGTGNDRIVLEREELEEIAKFIPSFKKMAKFWNCVSTRNEHRRTHTPGGNVHCYLPKGKLYGEDRIEKD